MSKRISKFLVIASCFVLLTAASHTFSAISCSVTTVAGCSGTVILKRPSTSSGHAELPSQSNYTQAICCTGVSGTACSGDYAIFLKLSSTTNAHVEEATNNTYTNNACISVASGTLSIGYQNTNCNGYDTTIASISSTTNAHVDGGVSTLPLKVCATLVASSTAPQSITFGISNNTIGFGNLSSSGARFATSDVNGSSTETEAHTIYVVTNAASGYLLTVRGNTLTSGINTINAIGGSNTASSVGSEQFGLRAVASGGSGTVSSPYSSSGFAYNASSTASSQVASASVGDSATTTYSLRYIANISPLTETGTYSTNLVYTVTANF